MPKSHLESVITSLHVNEVRRKGTNRADFATINTMQNKVNVTKMQALNHASSNLKTYWNVNLNSRLPHK